MSFDFAAKITQHSLQIRRRRVAQFMPECQAGISLNKVAHFHQEQVAQFAQE
jgi:hypothetical protein